MDSVIFPGRLGLQQRVLPAYRAQFFDTLSLTCTGGLSIFAGLPRPGEGIASTSSLREARLATARNYHFQDPSSPLFLLWQGDLLHWLEQWNPDALVVEANSRYLSTRQAVRWMHARGRPVLGWGLGAPPLTGGSFFGRLFSFSREWERRSFLRSLDGLIAYSRRGAAEYQRAGLPAERVFVASNAASPRPTQMPPQRPEGFVSRPVVLFVGRLQARKRLDHILRACAALPAALRPRLWIVGDGPEKAALQALAGEVYPLAEFPGALHGAELEPYFAAADLFVLPGTGGLAVQEAMAHGLPVIVAVGDGTQDDLVHSPGSGQTENGWLVPPDDLQALEAALQTALTDPARLRRMGAESYRIVSEEVNLEAMAAAFVHALNQVTRLH